ncbi:carbohydrate binding domain-containing protein [Zooshikella sp. RANM57]|uniref:carbohydrate binding domain-containing protein n=1 Tax=Zooshikella sp. RANM57 TaxID=3425863 RepID=UPI003D6F3871
MNALGKALLSPVAFAVASISTVAIAEPVVIDVMAVYTANTEKSNDMAARLNALVEYANQSYINSKINMRLRLVHHSALPTSEGFGDVIGDGDLEKLKNSEYVASLRAQYGADFVSLVGPATGYCGLGYVGMGDEKTNKLYSYAKSYAFNWVNIQCTSSYAHELGHNMSLGHSYAQGSKGGVYDWARGHGEDNIFVTTMAYQSAYSSGSYVPRLQYFSNPNVYACKGLACGKPITDSKSANAAEALNRLATQLADFMPTKVVDETSSTTTETTETTTETTTTETTTETTTTETTVTKTACKKQPVADNLVKDGDFNENSTRYWGSTYGGQLEITEVTNDCIDNVLHASNGRYSNGAYQPIEGLQLNTNYDFSAKVKIDSTANVRRDVQIFLVIPGQRYKTIKVASVTDQEFTIISERMNIEETSTLTSLETAYLFIHSPYNDTGLLIDEVKLTKSSEQPKPVVPASLLYSDFENGLQSWGAAFQSSIQLAPISAGTGYNSLAVTYRPYWYSGALYDVKGIIKSGKTYTVSADFRLDSASSGTQYADMRLYYIDDAGHHWVVIKRQPTAAGQWQAISGDITFKPVGQLRYEKLFFFGPNAGIKFNIDNVKVVEK